MPSHYDVIVVGCGITGATTAHFLKALGTGRVLLVERGQPASGGTGKSAAVVRQHYSTALMARLARESIGIFRDLESELGVTGVFTNSGYVMLVPPDLMAPATANLERQRSVGVVTDFLPREAWEERLPWLATDGVAGVIHEPDGGYADPIRSTEGFVETFRRAGGEVRLRTPVRELLREGDRVTGILLDEGPVLADVVVNAAGPWAVPLARSARIEMPMRTVREQDTIWQARPGRPIPTTSVSNAVDAIYMVPQGEDRILIGRGFPKDYYDVDAYNYKETLDDDFVSVVLERAVRRVSGLEGMRLVHGYAALYDVTPDWYPFIGPRSGLSGYVDACGGSGHGFKIGPAIGRELARWIHSGEVASDFAGLSHDRIAAGRLFAGAYGGNRG